MNHVCQRNGGLPHLLLLSLVAAVLSGCGPSETSDTNNLPNSAIGHATASPDGNQLLYSLDSRSDNIVGIWHRNTLKTTWLEPMAGSVMFLSFMSDGEHFAVAESLHRKSPVGWYPRLAFYETKTAKREQYVDLPASTRHILCANEKWIVIYSVTEIPTEPEEPSKYSASVPVWRRGADGWAESGTLAGLSKNNKTGSVQFIDDNSVVAIVGHGKEVEKEWQWQNSEIMIVNLDTQKVLRRATTNVKGGNISVSKGGKYVAIGNRDAVEVYDTLSLTRQGKCSFHDIAYDYPLFAVSRDGRYVAVAGDRLEVHDLQTNTVVLRDKGHEDIIRSKTDLTQLCTNESMRHDSIVSNIWLRADFCYGYIGFVDSGKKLVGVTGVGELRIWDIAKRKLLVAERLTAPKILMEIEEAFANQPGGTEKGD